MEMAKSARPVQTAEVLPSTFSLPCNPAFNAVKPIVADGIETRKRKQLDPNKLGETGVQG